jgi:hypothetical protein
MNWFDEYIEDNLPPPGGETTPPTITIVSIPAKSTDPYVVQIYDASGLAQYQVSCKDRPDGARLVIYDPTDGGFIFPFNGKSTISGSGTSISPYTFTIYRLGRWPTGILLDVKAKAVDTHGNTASG